MAHGAMDRESDSGGASASATKRCAGYAVYDPLDQKIGSAEELFLNRDAEPQSVRVRIGLFGTRSVFIPVRFVEVDDERQTLVLK